MFKTWLENIERKIPVDPDEVVPTLYRSLPSKNEQPNETEVNIFVEKMVENDVDIAATFNRGNAVHQDRYDEPLVKLTNINDPKLGRAYGLVTSTRNSRFYFAHEKGEVWIICPPAIYFEEDKILLASVIRHEAQHAIDHVLYNFPSSKIISRRKIEGEWYCDSNAYYTAKNEARAYSDQFEYILKRMNYDVDKVINALELKHRLSKPTDPVVLDSEVIEVARKYLEKYRKTEARMVKELFGEIEEPAITASINKEYAQRAGVLLCRIIKLLKFGNFVKKS